MKTRQNAPRSVGRTCIAASASDRSGELASSVVIRSESVVAPIEPGCGPSSATRSASSLVLVRLPLWPRARLPPVTRLRKLGWAFSQVPLPVVE
jgi:hypothetical protein